MAKKTIVKSFFNGTEGEKGVKPVFTITLVREKGWPGTAEEFQLAAEAVVEKSSPLLQKELKKLSAEQQ